MEAIIIDDIPFDPDPGRITGPFKIKPGSSREGELVELLKAAKSIARPKALYRLVEVEIQSDNVVLLDGQPFQSRVLCVNLSEVHRAFPFVVTCGMELHEWKSSFEDLFTGYLADFITSLALEVARVAFSSHMHHQYGLGRTATMNPGSLEDWPIQVQVPFFDLLGDPGKAIGVNLTESLLMIPRHSVSGILFETETDYVNCQLCPRETCSNRRAPYDEDVRSQYLSHWM